ncbi:MAG: tetratricopeptide repeat protein [Acidobacteria bacterium]|nr:tetratricopeptide repeat protein [Acidobacteriota bacterium]
MDDKQALTREGSRVERLGYPLLIIGVGALVYLNSFEGSFVFDDALYINTALHSLRQTLAAPNLISRPLIGVTLVLNYALSGAADWSYHLFNLLVHLCAALCLYGVVRRTLLTQSWRDRFGKRAATLALIIALLWMVHPLQTQAVTYIIQRCESLMGLCYLLTLYSAVRSFSATKKLPWVVAMLAACAAGMLAKQVMVTAPLMVWLYDYMFISPSWKSIWQQRKGMYIGLAATWGLLAVTFMAAPSSTSAGFSVTTISPLAYFLTEFQVLVHYLGLAVYPHHLSLDYGWKAASGMGEILPFAMPILTLQVATLWGLYRRQAVAFLGAWFFGILALTSSFMPLTDLAIEHRMYLSLAAVVTAVVLGADRLMVRITTWRGGFASLAKPLTLAIVTLLVMTLGLLTVRRNMDYKSELVLWQDNVNKRPQSVRAQINLGKALLDQGLDEQAIIHFTEGLKYEPASLEGRNNLGRALLNLGRAAEAKEHLLIAVAQRPNAVVYQNLGEACLELGEVAPAIEQFSMAINMQPDNPKTHYLLGVAFEKQGKLEEALSCMDETLTIDENYADAWSEKALIYMSASHPQIRDRQKAIACAEQAVTISKSQYGRSLEVLGRVYAEVGRYSEAIDVTRQATLSLLARTNPKFAETCAAHLNRYLEKMNNEAAHP